MTNEQLLLLIFAILTGLSFLQIFVFGGWKLGLAFLLTFASFAGFMVVLLR